LLRKQRKTLGGYFILPHLVDIVVHYWPHCCRYGTTAFTID